MPKRKQVRFGLFTSFLIAVFGLSGLVFAFTAATNTSLLTAITHAESGEGSGGDEEDDKDEDEDEKDDEDEDDDDEKDELEKEQEKKAKEAAKRKAEQQRELLKKKAELLKEQAKKRDELKNAQMREFEKVEEEKNKDEEKKAEIIEKINEEIIDAEERIARAQAEGIDVTKALATLATAKEKARAAETALTTISYEELRRIEREVKKLAHFASHKDVKSARDIQKDVDKISKRIAQTEGKISLYESLGGDPEGFTAALGVLVEDFNVLKANLAKGGQEQIDAMVALEPLERKVKSLKSGVESAIYALGGTDERHDDDYENEVEDIFDDLNDVAEIEGDEIGEEIKKIALEQRSSAASVGKSVEALDKRNRILQFLFGTSGSEVSKLENEIAANENRIAVLSQVASTIEDPEVKAILEEQIESLKTETSKLETFVDSQKNRLSAFGWFFNLT